MSALFTYYCYRVIKPKDIGCKISKQKTNKHMWEGNIKINLREIQSEDAPLDGVERWASVNTEMNLLVLQKHIIAH
jgi:hypothetical protein